MMEETLGKRIAQHRKRLSLTQETLAEQLGVTAQAVSKWENDQSCPDIALLPGIAAVFGITVDALLGCEQKEERTIVVAEPAVGDSVPQHKTPERRAGIGVALWLVLVGIIKLAENVSSAILFPTNIWQTACLSGLLVFGLMGLRPRFSLFRLGCALFGGYYLLCSLINPRVMLNQELLIPILLIFFGLGLLVDRPWRKARMSIEAAGQNVFSYKGNSFVCTTGFGADHRVINLPMLEGGEGKVFFGELEIDLHDCGNITADCRIALQCAFGSMTVYVPRRWRLQCVNRTFFGVVQEHGAADMNTEGVLRLENYAAFGEIRIEYI